MQLLPFLNQLFGKKISTIAQKIIPAEYRPIGYIMTLAYKRAHGAIISGPFQGMSYLDNKSGSVGSCYIPKLLGIYEKELYPTIEKALNSHLDFIINIGGGEGYYAVGMAFRNPKSRVFTFEMNPRGRKLISTLAKQNNVEDRVIINGKCEISDLQNILEANSGEDVLIIMDVEGYEKTLLDPESIPSLSRCHILVELHDFIDPTISPCVKERFSSTHQIEEIWQQARSPEEFPFSTLYTKLLPSKYLNWAVSEWRPVTMCWYWLTPHSW